MEEGLGGRERVEGWKESMRGGRGLGGREEGERVGDGLRGEIRDNMEAGHSGWV